MTPIACAVPGCGQTRRIHDATDHRYQVPDLNLMRERANELKTRTAANICVTCDLAEDRWNPSDPLYLEGGTQCPDCNRWELNDEATRKHAEAAS